MSNTGGSAGGLPPLNVRIQINTTGAGAAASAMRQVTGAAGGMGRSVATSAVPIRMMGDAMRQTASLMKYTVLGVFTNMGTQAIQMSRQFELSMSRIQGLVGITAGEVNKMKEQILDLGGATTKTPQELADALYFITSSGFQGAEAMEILTQAAQSAAAGLGETQVVADALTSIMSAYGEGVYSAAQANDILTVAVREGKAEAEDFAPALGKVLPVAAAFGASFEDVAAGVAALTRTGASAGTSAIYLRQVLSQLLKPSKQAADAMYAAGTSAEDMRQRISEDGLLSALETLNARLGGSQYEIASTGLAKVFGNVRALTAVYSLLGPNLQENRQIFEEMAGSTGAASDAFEVAAQTADAKFRSAMAEMQAALIRVGDAIMPMVTMFVQLGGTIANVAQSVLSIGDGLGFLSKAFRGTIKTVLLLGAGLVIASKVGLGMFRTYSSLVRLFGNAQIVMRGLTFGMRSNSAAALTQNNVFQGLIQTTRQQTVARAMLQRAEANGTLSVQKGLQILGKYNSSTLQQVQLNRAAATANTATGATYTQVAAAAGVATSATRTFGQTLVASLPLVFGIATAIFTVASMFGMFGKNDKGLDSDISKLEDLNQVLGGTVKLDEIDIQVAFKTDFYQGRGDTGLTPEELKELEDNVIKPAKIDKAISNAIDTYGAGSDQAAEFGAAIVKRLGLTGEANEKLKSYLANELSVDASVFDDVKFTGTGRGGAVISSQIASAILGTEGIDGTVAEALKNADTSNSQAALNALLSGFDIAPTVGEKRDIENAVKNIGQTIGASFDKTGNITVFQQSLEQVGSAINATSALAADKQELFRKFTQSAFSNITEMGDFKNEVGGLLGIMQEGDNQDALIATFTKLTGSTATAAIAAKAFKTEFDKLGEKATPEEQYLAFSRALNTVTQQQYNFGESSDDVIGKVEKQVKTTFDLADAFDNGLNPTIQAVVDEYKNYSDAVDRITAGQEAVIDFNSSGVNAAIDFAEAQRDVTEAITESGGSLAFNTEAGANAIKAIQDYTKNLGKVAAVQALDPEQGPAVASQTINEGYLELIRQITIGGKRTQEEAKAILGELGIDPISLLNSITPGELDTGTAQGKTFVQDLVDGAGIAYADGGKQLAPEIKAFNDAMLAEIQEYWKIESPSKNAATWIGQPIMKGIIDGMTGAKSLQYAKKNIPTLLAAIKKEMVDNGEVVLPRVIGGGGAGNLRAMRVMPKNFDPYNDKGGLGDTGAGLVSTVVSGITNGTSSAVSKVATRLGKLTGAALQKSAAGYLKALKDKETPVIDLIEKVIGDSSSALGTVGSYISAQISLNDAIANNTKLTNEQLGLQQQLAEAQREQLRSVRKVGSQMGAEVTDYEQARIEELQKTYEKVQRDYSMRRATVADLIDAEDALNEARISASEVSPDAIDAQNKVVDSQTAIKNAGLELSKAIYDVVNAQFDLTQSAIDFKIYGAQAAAVFQRFADMAFPGLEYRVGTATGVIHKAGLALSEDKGVFLQSIKGLGTSIYNMLATAIKEAAASSSVLDFVPPAEEPVIKEAPTATNPNFTPAQANEINIAFQKEIMLYKNAGLMNQAGPGGFSPREILTSIIENVRGYASGGLVTKPELAVVGEKGPELIVPLSGLGVTTALQNLVPVGSGGTQQAPSSNQVFNITVNNPVPETASDSISRRMKSLANAGLFG
jgi:TP901 family phage tail tape measure protein